MTSQLKIILKSLTEFSNEELRLMNPFMESFSLKKNQIILEEGRLCSHIYFVESGSLRNCYNKDGLDVNLSFTFENQFTTNFEAYLNHEPSKIIIQAMEQSVIWTINSRALRRGNPDNVNIATFIRRLAIRMLFATEEHHNMMRMNTPADRYNYLLQKKPELIQKVSLTNLASYIGITRETLSRIRSNKY